MLSPTGSAYSPTGKRSSSNPASPLGRQNLSNPPSPSGRQLADDLRKITSSLLISTGSPCSSPRKSPISASTGFNDAGQQESKSVLQVSLIVEELRSAFQSLKQQSESDREACRQQLKQFERTLVPLAVDPQKHAELQGRVDGVLHQVQALARRVDSVDERVNARIHVAEESMRQQTTDLENRLHSILQESRVGASGLERSLEAHPRQVAELRPQNGSRFQASSTLTSLQQQCSKLEDRLEGLQRDIELLTRDRLEMKLFTAITSSVERSLEEQSQQFQQDFKNLAALQQQCLQFEDKVEGLQQDIEFLTQDRLAGGCKNSILVTLFTTIVSSLERSLEEQSQQFQQNFSSLSALQLQSLHFEGKLEGLQSNNELLT